MSVFRKPWSVASELRNTALEVQAYREEEAIVNMDALCAAAIEKLREEAKRGRLSYALTHLLDYPLQAKNNKVRAALANALREKGFKLSAPATEYWVDVTW